MVTQGGVDGVAAASRTRRRSHRQRKPRTKTDAGAGAEPEVDDEELVAAVESLYADELRPRGEILLKRVKEKQSGVWPDDTRTAVQRLKLACQACELLEVRDGLEGGEWIALLAERRDADFLDVRSQDDAYGDKFWSSLEQYLDKLQEDDPLDGGRYACAKDLQGRALPFLKTFSLGKINHVVELSLSKRLLGYKAGSIVPYRHSVSKTKDNAAAANKALKQRYDVTESSGLASVPQQAKGDHASLEQVREKLLLYWSEKKSKSNRRSKPVALSSLKKLFQRRWSLELSETALGFAKLSDLLQDSTMRDVCCVDLTGDGYVVRPPRPQPSATASATPSTQAFFSPMSRVDEAGSSPGSLTVARTFLHMNSLESISSTEEGSRRRAGSLPKDLACLSGSKEGRSGVTFTDDVSTLSPPAVGTALEDSPLRLKRPPKRRLPPGLVLDEGVPSGHRRGLPLVLETLSADADSELLSGLQIDTDFCDAASPLASSDSRRNTPYHEVTKTPHPYDTPVADSSFVMPGSISEPSSSSQPSAGATRRRELFHRETPFESDFVQAALRQAEDDSAGPNSQSRPSRSSLQTPAGFSSAKGTPCAVSTPAMIGQRSPYFVPKHGPLASPAFTASDWGSPRNCPAQPGAPPAIPAQSPEKCQLQILSPPPRAAAAKVRSLPQALCLDNLLFLG